MRGVGHSGGLNPTARNGRRTIAARGERTAAVAVADAGVPDCAKSHISVCAHAHHIGGAFCLYCGAAQRRARWYGATQNRNGAWGDNLNDRLETSLARRLLRARRRGRVAGARPGLPRASAIAARPHASGGGASVRRQRRADHCRVVAGIGRRAGCAGAKRRTRTATAAQSSGRGTERAGQAACQRHARFERAGASGVGCCACCTIVFADLSDHREAARARI